MKLEVISPEKELYSGEVEHVTFPGTGGSFGVLKDHAPIVSTLKKGEIIVTELNKTIQTISVTSGVVEIFNNKISVLAE